MKTIAMRRTLMAAAILVFSAHAYAGDAAAGKDKAAKQCAACHGENGVSQAPDFPNLAGQHYDYLVRALKDYQSGARKNPIMSGQAANLKPADIDDVAEYFSSLKGLTTKR